MRLIRTAFSQNRSRGARADIIENPIQAPMSAKSGRDKYARLEQVRQNLIGEAKKSQGKIDDFLKK
jgi:hypothetical protein